MSFKQTALGWAMSVGLMSSASAASIDPVWLTSTVREQLEMSGIPGLSIAVVSQGRPDYVHGFGVRSAGSSEPVDERTQFKINSITKSMMATAIAVEVDRGVVRWTDRLSELYPSFQLKDPWVSREATLQDALSHRIGVEATDWLDDIPGVTLEDAIGRLRYLPQQAPFRAEFVYDNFMFSAAGVAASARSGGWKRVLQKNLLEPLGMKATTADFDDNVRPSELAPCSACEIDHPPLGSAALRTPMNVAIPHTLAGTTARPMHWARSITGPSGGLWSTAQDMARYLKLYLNDGVVDGTRVLSTEAMRTLGKPVMYRTDKRTPDVTRGPQYVRRASQFGWHYGLGWEISQYLGHRIIHNSGKSAGFRSQVMVLPDDGLAIVVMANAGDGTVDITRFLALDIIERALKIAPYHWTRNEVAFMAKAAAPIATPPMKPSPITAASYVGTYVHAAYGEMHITQASDGILHVDQGPMRTGTLRALQPGALELTWQGIRPGPYLVSVVADQDGVAQALELRGQRFNRAPAR
ncbi:serine hydrolase domain-containing protein [Peristeroidobacter soli]|uniref:serine hydrolase domain-containing protein n=1 Tax=Peristeroidobacter soli TaxID=2497877 RepID=UPI0013003975|nr:serine hydrolase domain-containing protein [Peristeroidobacter soli]